MRDWGGGRECAALNERHDADGWGVRGGGITADAVGQAARRWIPDLACGAQVEVASNERTGYSVYPFFVRRHAFCIQKVGWQKPTDFLMK